MSHNLKAVIFDMDGLIIDSEPTNSLSWEILLKKYGKKPVYNKHGLIHTVGLSGDEGYLQLIQKYRLREDLEILRELRRKIFEDIIEKINLMPGFSNLIKVIKKEGFKTALASNRNIKHVILIAEKLGVKNFFDVIIGPDVKRKHKPEPDIYLDAAKKLGVLSENCLVIEDSEIRVSAACKAGMKVIAVPNKHIKTHDFSKADKIVNNLNDISISLLYKLSN